ncbi:MAG: pilus assembly protein TadG-related protein [Isosphaeraceae bacterium]|nr:pilus assembly protein TadG-related protein [Isosphaeraceae bacterium]
MIPSTRPHAGRPWRRRGTVLPALALMIVAMAGFLALAIDVGMLAIAKTQAQQAADLAALTAARTVNGSATGNYNQSTATTNAQNILSYNSILGQTIASSQLQLTYGSYDYNQSTQTFSANFPPTTGVPTTAVAATVTSTSIPGGFSKVFGTQLLPNVTASAQAVHRPRDIALALDLSGSMRMGTCMGFDFYTTSRSSNNPDSLVPTFGHYSSASANMQGPSTNQTSASSSYTISPSNTTAANTSYSLTYINNFYQNSAYATTLVRAFDSYTGTNGGTSWSAPTTGTPVLPPTSYTTTPGGDVPLFVKGSTSNYATSVKDVLGSTARNASWELDGYSNYTAGTLTNAAVGQSSYTNAPFYGYTQGPAYYGVTFFVWPPDPREPLTTANDSTQIGQFLLDFGFTGSPTSKTGDFSGTKGTALLGVYNSNATTGSHAWPWPNDGGSSLSSYLTSKVYIPGGSRLLKTTDAQYQQIMRLYSWNYVVDNLGTTPCDWRMRFFGQNDNTKLFNSNGSLNLPGGSTYTINYNEILRWITTGPNPFPQQLRAGRIKYYGSIPTAITGSWPSYGSTDQRFWVEFIDYVLGFRQTSAGVYQDISGMAGYGSDFKWGTTSITAPPASPTQYMTYSDNPARPLSRYWFGPMAMVDYMQNYNLDSNVSNYFFMQPGDSYEAPLYTAKEAYMAAVDTMQNNHPNDWVTIVPYSWPRSAVNGTSGRFNCVSCPLGTNYDYASSALLFPFSTINADGSANNTEITPYDPDPATGAVPSANFVDAPRADGDTCFAMALMLSYNQFATTSPTDTTLRSYASSSPINFPTGMAGGMGRKGAQKVVIFETDGLANCSATASLVSNGTYSYYKIRYNMNSPNGSEYPSINATNINDSTVLNQVYSLVQQLSSTYSTTRNPFRLYAVGFGPVFQGPNASSALQTLQTMQYYAGTQSSTSTPLASNQVITGTDAQMSANMIATFTAILQNGVQVALTK